jgi:hypothetical protein
LKGFLGKIKIKTYFHWSKMGPYVVLGEKGLKGGEKENLGKKIISIVF